MIDNPLDATLRSGRFVLTAELECPRGASARNVERQATSYAGLVDAVNCTDNSAAVVRMSPVAAAAIAARAGVTPIVQLTCRDRNRIALQSDILGAAAVGAAAVVCMWGDPPAAGNHPEATAVYDLATLELIRAVTHLAGGRFLSGDPVATPPRLIAGAVASPEDSDAAVENLRAKAEAGAQFLQTQITYDVSTVEAWLARVRDAGLDRRLKILLGIAPIRRPAVLRFLDQQVAGVTIPENVKLRLARADDFEVEGVRIAGEMLAAARCIEGIAGAHIMTFGWREGVARVIAAADVGARGSWN